jgi:predicted NACHT family NTPase
MNPWQLTVQETGRSSRLLASGTRIADVYNDARGELLILGKPGSGKTTLLLDLTRDLLRLAEEDHTQPIPLVFHLSSWAEKCLPLSTWLIEELHSKYDIPQPLGREFVYKEQFILLLDGLDEVAEQHRAACITTINAHRREYNLIPTVVCCRKAEYEALGTPLLLHRSVVIQPLTPLQIDEYLEATGKDGARVQTMLRDDPDLQELAMTPLMLNVLLHAYRGKTSGELTMFHDKKTKQQQIFARYVQKVLERRGVDKRYSMQKTKHQMKYLAQYMYEKKRSIFYLEQMRADWLPAGLWRLIYELVGVRLPDALVGASSSLLVASILSNAILPFLFALPYIIFGGLLGVLMSRKRQEEENDVHA